MAGALRVGMRILSRALRHFSSFFFSFFVPTQMRTSVVCALACVKWEAMVLKS